MALTTRDYEFLAKMLRDATQYDDFGNDEGSRINCKTLRKHIGEKILSHAIAQNPSFNTAKFKVLARL